MITVRPGNERGHANHGWLETYHSFSFANYYDPKHMGFRALRVINEDHIQPGRGFGAHGHRDMEILTYVLAGTLEHRDSLGTGALIQAGEVQRMSAGTGIVHSEFNPSETEPVHLLQIWILPDQSGLPPSYEQRSFSPAEKLGQLRLIAAKEGREAALTLHQDLDLYATILEPTDRVVHPLNRDRHAWVQIVRGHASLNGQPLEAGDGAAVSGSSTPEISLSTSSGAEILLFDLA